MRARRIVLVAATAFVVLPLWPSPAAAGGSWLTPRRPTYVPGEVAIVGGGFGTGSYAGEIDDGPFIAYLLPANRWIEGRNLPKAAIPVGELVISGGNGSYRARIEFRVPNVSGGLYHLQYCNDPCTIDGLGDLIGSQSFAVGATRTEARLLMSVERLRGKIGEVRYHARFMASEHVREVGRELRTTQRRLGIEEERVRKLDTAVEALRSSIDSDRSRLAAATVGNAALLLAVIALLIVLVAAMRRLRAARLDAELRAITDEPVRGEVTHR
ncbi:MAG TPA: hypothetical protein VFA25_11820 [Actinomycetota bacterium]|nr:hypothetical protein [Actinomycetota bacterium]